MLEKYIPNGFRRPSFSGTEAESQERNSETQVNAGSTDKIGISADSDVTVGSHVSLFKSNAKKLMLKTSSL